jgi:hypothetical protein
MKKFTTIALAAAVAMFGATAMAQTSQNINVEIQVGNYAELTVNDGLIILHLVDSDDWLSGLNDGPNGKFAELTLQANYLTNLVVTSNSGIMETHHGYDMVLTSDNGNELGAWPQITGTVPATGQAMFTWDSDEQEVVMNALSAEFPGGGIPAGTHPILVGVSSRLSNTADGEWAPAGTYNGSLTVTVVDHP